jgi:hypothetical protein
MIGAIPDETPLASLPTGQRVSTGKTRGYDVDFSLMAGDVEQCTRMSLWREQVKNHVPGYLDSATLVHKNDRGKAALETTITEIFPSSFDAPGGSDDGDGEAAKRTGKFSVWETKTINS